MDNTLGTKSNRVQLNIPHVLGAMDAPEPGIACVFVDGIPIHAPHFVSIQAQIGQVTKVCITFEAEISGTIGGKPVDDIMRDMRDNHS